MKSFRLCLFTLTYGTICFCGLIYQTILITDEYFKYGVSTSTVLSETITYTLPSLTTCFKFYEIFDVDRYNQKHGSNFIYNNTDADASYFSGLQLQNLVTIDDMYQFTPPVNEIADRCEIRDSGDYQYRIFDSKECVESQFQIDKFLIASFACYKLTLKSSLDKKVSDQDKKYSRETAYFVPSDQGDIYFFFLNQTRFKSYEIIINVLHPIDNYPWYEFPLSQTKRRGYDVTTGKPKINMFGSKSNSVAVNKLAPPYVTNCQDYKDRNYRDSQHCLLECTNDKIKIRFKRASLSYHYFKGEDLKLLSSQDFNRSDFNHTYRSIMNDCHSACPFTDCHFSSTYTKTQGSDYPITGVYVHFPDTPSYTINYRPSVLLIDTITYIASALGVWFGFSFYQIKQFLIRSDNSKRLKIDVIKRFDNRSKDNKVTNQDRIVSTLAKTQMLVHMLITDRVRAERRLKLELNKFDSRIRSSEQNMAIMKRQFQLIRCGDYYCIENRT